MAGKAKLEETTGVFMSLRGQASAAGVVALLASLAVPAVSVAAPPGFSPSDLALPSMPSVSTSGSGLTGSLEGSPSLLAPVDGGMQEAEEAAATRRARLSTPEALAADVRSRLAYAGYGRTAAVGLAERTFGIDRPRWNPLRDQGTGTITGYDSENVARVSLPDGGHGLLSSSLPLRSAIGSGQSAPVSLALKRSGSGYAPENPLVPVVIGQRASEGASFVGGLRVTPTGAEGGEPSQVVGDSVFYPGAGSTDFMLEPMPTGVEASWQLLSQESSEENSLSFSLPEGARLQLSKTLEGAAEVSLEGQRLMLVAPASASEANGEDLPVTYTVEGDKLITHVNLSGDIDFPVEVDPILTIDYGGASRFWTWWQFAGEGLAYQEGGNGNTGILAGIHPNSIPDSWASWGLFAPGWPSEGAIARAYVAGYEHYAAGQSDSETGIVNSDGSPTWTYEPYNPNGSHAGLLLTNEQFGGRSAWYCADGNPGGYEGGSSPLCNNNYGGQYFRLTVDTSNTHPYLQSTMIEGIEINYLDTSKLSTSLSYNGGWIGPSSGEHFSYTATDTAFGVAWVDLQLLRNGSWETIYENDYGGEGDCVGVICPASPRIELDYPNLAGRLPNGEDRVRVLAHDPSGIVSETEGTLKVDSTPPHSLAVSGADVKGETVNITEGQAGDQVTAEASDGESGVVSSGVRELALEVDEHRIAGSDNQDSCSPGPCTAKASWTLNGRELGAGVHSLTITATDDAGNIEHKTYRLVVHAAGPMAMGPGSVNPQSGDFALESTDVDLKDSAGALMVTRHFDSRNTKEGVEGPLGPQWTISLGQLSSLEVLGESEGKNQGVIVTGPEGVTFFSPDGNNGFEASEEPSLSLTLINNGSEYVLTNTKKGASTAFTKPAGAEVWLPTVSKGPVATDALTDTYKSVTIEGKVVVDPMEELAPHSGSLSCPPELSGMQKGCRALLFSYGGEHTEQAKASGESESQWGWHEGRLTSVAAVAWSNSAKEMQEVPVAEYSYDAQGRLRAEWDPRIKPALKTTYGYDAEGQVTALSPPGQEPWIMSYGTIAGDASGGRLVKVMRAKASAPLSTAPAPALSEAPQISGVLAVGMRLAVSDGVWTNSPLSYAFQWERCNAQGEECVAIAGAINANYAPVTADVGHKLVAQVTATNTAGSTVSNTAASGAVTSIGGRIESYTQTVQNGDSFNAASCIPSGTDCVLADSRGNLFYSTDVSAGASAEWHAWSGPAAGASHAVDCSVGGLCLLAAGSAEGAGGNLFYAGSLGGSWSEAYKPSYGVDAISCASMSFCVTGQDGGGYFRWSTSPASTSWNLEKQGAAAMKAAFCLSSSFCTLADSEGSVLFATSTSQIESDAWTSTDVDGSKALEGIACTSTSSCVAVDNNGAAIKLTIAANGTAIASSKDIDGSRALTGVSCAGSSTCVAVDGGGHVFLSTNAGESWSEALALTGDLTSVSCASPALCLIVNSAGGDTAIDPEAEVHEALPQPAQPGSTLEYDVPVEGITAPYAVGHKEVETWGQKDDPAEGFEVFPEEHPQTWPAEGHTGATVYYTDAEAQQVNVAAPSGGVATTEYNGEGDVERSLSADNRERALKEANPVQAAEKLATLSKYAEGELSEVTGPEHLVKLSSGEEVQARNRVRYFYDEGAPQSEKYELVTKTTDGALLANGEEKDVRTTLTGYGGSTGIGWKLRAPISTTIEPTGADLVSETKYNANGQVIETRSPGGTVASAKAPLVYRGAFGSHGNGEGQFSQASGVAINASDDVLAADYTGDRVDEFTGTGEFIRSFGSKGTGAGQIEGPLAIAVASGTGDLYVTDSGNDRVDEFTGTGEFIRSFGSKGAGQGEFETPDGITIDGKGDVWVADEGNNRIEQFTGEGVFVAAYGEHGTGNGELNDPMGLAAADSRIYVVDRGNNRVQYFNEKGEYQGKFGAQGTSNGDFENPGAIAATSGGELYVVDVGNRRVQRFSSSGAFESEFRPRLKEALLEGVTVNSKGEVYVSEIEADRVQRWSSPSQGVHDTKTFYYTPGEEAGVAACDNHPEWEGLVCRTEPASQPADSASEPKGSQLPRLPVVTTEYNMWFEPVKITESFGATARTKTTNYEGQSERVASQAITAGAGKALPAVRDSYSLTLGLLSQQSSESEGKIQTLTSTFNTLGELETYTDASGNVTAYNYDQYGRLQEVDYDASRLDGMEAKQTLSYQQATGELAEVDDQGGTGTFKGSGAGAFDASYDLEGNMTSISYPDGLSAAYTYNSVGVATALAYTKHGDCMGSECEWFNETIEPSVHGEAITQTSTLTGDSDAYNAFGQPTEIKETPTGEGCTTQVYYYDREGARTSLLSRKPGEKGACAKEGGTSEGHTYDEAGRLTDEGVTYEALGDITALPASDAGGHEIQTTYYADGQAASQNQSGIANSYTLDPEGRTDTTETFKEFNTVATAISHYATPGETEPSWTFNETAGSWTRSIIGFGGLLATEESGREAVLQLRSLQGNIVATASPSETVGKPLSTERSTTFGVPVSEKPTDEYNWLGASEITASLPSGAIIQDGTTYVPQLGASLQTHATAEAPITNVTPPVVISVPSPVITKYEEAHAPSDPSAGLPKSVKCGVQVLIGEEKGWVWVRAWMSCPGYTMPANAYLQAALYMQDANGYAPIESEEKRGYAVNGYEYPDQLYAHVHEECVSEVIYYGVAIYGMPTDPPEKVQRRRTEDGWECGESRRNASANLVWTIIETIEVLHDSED